MKTLTILSTLLWITAASSVFAQGIGFEGLTLGMKVSELQALVDSTDREYFYRPEDLETDTDTYAILKPSDGICSDDLECYEPTQVTVDLFQSRIWQIRIGSDRFTDTAGVDSVLGFYRAAYATIEKVLGAPTNVILLPSQLSQEHKRILTTTGPHCITLAQWRGTPSFTKTSLPITGKTTVQVVPEVEIRYNCYSTEPKWTDFVIYIRDKTVLEKRMKGLDFPR